MGAGYRILPAKITAPNKITSIKTTTKQAGQTSRKIVVKLSSTSKLNWEIIFFLNIT